MEEYKAFIIYSTYRVNAEKNKARIHLFGRLENNSSFEAVFDFEPYFFIKKDQKKDAENILKHLDIKTELIDVKLENLYDEPVIKIKTDIPGNVPILRKAFEKANISCYEADIRFSQRFLMDNKINASCIFLGKPEKKNTLLFFENPKIKPSDYNPKNLKILSIDIETSMTAKILYSISLYSKDISTVLINSKSPNLKAETFSKEKDLLLRFKQIIEEHDPDIITGWNVIDFDFAKLKDFFKKHKIKFKFGRLDEECTLRLESSFLKDSNADFKGRILLDALRLAKISFIKLPDYKLNTAAREILNDEKLLTSEDRGNEIEDLFLNNQQKLIDYNLKDSKLVYDILMKSGMITLSIQRSKLTGLMLDKIQASIASFDSVYLPKLREKGKVAFNLQFDDNREQIIGGFVLPSKPGIYDWVIVCDFKSLYPSIMRTFNIDPYSYLYKNPFKEKDIDSLKKTEYVVAPNKAVFKNQEGILSEILGNLMILREEAKTNKNALSSYAIKILMNSFFGVLASHNCKFSTLELGNSITSFAHLIIKKTMKLIEEKGYSVIYGDTDSVFIDLEVKNFEEAEKIGQEIENYINEFLKKWVSENYNRESFLYLEFEKIYKRFLIPKIRGKEAGAKKRYAGLKITKSSGKLQEKIDFTGLEFVRRDWTEVSKDFQLGIINRIFHKQEITGFIKEFIKDLKKGKYDNKLLYKKALRKQLSEYTKTTPPHVKAARKMKKITSNIIEYYMTVDGPEPKQDRNHSIDYDHYIEKQLKPIADSVLVFYNDAFDDIISGSKQKNLFGF